MPGDAEDQHRPLSGSRWSAGSEKDRTREARALLGGKCERNTLEPERDRQLRRLRRKRSRGEKDRGADRAIIVVVARVLRRELLRRRRGLEVKNLGNGARSPGSAADMHIADVNVPKGQRDLQHKCRKSKPRPASPVEPNPPHSWHANVTMLHLARGTTFRALLECGGESEPHRQRLYRMQSITPFWHTAVGAVGGPALGKHMANRLSVLSSEP
jgi:hypothetical protein